MQAALQGRVTEAEARAGAQLAAIADRQARLKNAARAASPTAPPFEALEALEAPARDGTGAGALPPCWIDRAPRNLAAAIRNHLLVQGGLSCSGTLPNASFDVTSCSFGRLHYIPGAPLRATVPDWATAQISCMHAERLVLTPEAYVVTARAAAGMPPQVTEAGVPPLPAAIAQPLPALAGSEPLQLAPSESMQVRSRTCDP